MWLVKAGPPPHSGIAKLPFVGGMIISAIGPHPIQGTQVVSRVTTPHSPGVSCQKGTYAPTLAIMAALKDNDITLDKSVPTSLSHIKSVDTKSHKSGTDATSCDVST